MWSSSRFSRGVMVLVSCIATWSGCAHSPKSGALPVDQQVGGIQELKIEEPVALKLKSVPGRVETVTYLHRATSKSFQDGEIRHQKEESVEFTARAEPVKNEPETERFTQRISIVRKDGSVDLHDFAMPEVGEKLDVTFDSQGRIHKSGDYPSNSIFFVSPISLPEAPVQVGDTWTMQASWLSLGEMVPYQLDMVSILKGFWRCGNDRCAEIEVSGEVGFQGPLAQAMSFKSEWKGRLLFAVDAGTVIWSRTENEDQLMAESVRREVKGCLEAVIQEPKDLKPESPARPVCEGSTVR